MMDGSILLPVPPQLRFAEAGVLLDTESFNFEVSSPGRMSAIVNARNSSRE